MLAQEEAHHLGHNFVGTEQILLGFIREGIGSKSIQQSGSELGFEFSEYQVDSQYSRITSIVNEELKQYFRPEFLNRLDEIIVFRQLTKGEVKQICNILLREVFSHLTERDITLKVTERFKDHLVEEGYQPELGARPLGRAITRLLVGKTTLQKKFFLSV